jgi:hypothetical protein
MMTGSPKRRPPNSRLRKDTNGDSFDRFLSRVKHCVSAGLYTGVP